MKSLEQLMGERTVRFRKASPLLAGGFAQLPRVVTRAGRRISPMAKITFATLLDYAWQDGFCFPAQERLARDIGTNEKSVRKYLAELQALEMIEVKKQGRGLHNVYILNDTAPVLKEVQKELEREMDERG
ncbi:helix-turn-helix domain-containing protein [Pontivivens insulae]|nr:helix-turn-helix domain-containing protein [Pontivivens insulae]